MNASMIKKENKSLLLLFKSHKKSIKKSDLLSQVNGEGEGSLRGDAMVPKPLGMLLKNVICS